MYTLKPKLLNYTTKNLPLSHYLAPSKNAHTTPRLQPTKASPTSNTNKSISEADLYISIDQSSTPPSPLSSFHNTPWFIQAPITFFGIIAFLRTIKFITKRLGNRDDTLQERGYKRGSTADQDYYSKLMKNMRTVHYEELTDEQVQAARMRRRQEIERDGSSTDLDAIELPENHPFAVKQKVSPEEEELQRLRLSARRGLSPEDMRLLKQQQALADQMDAEEERRQAQAAADKK